MSTPYRIAYISLGDPDDRRSWSGGLWSMAEALRSHAGEVTCLGPIDQRVELRLGKLINNTIQAATGKRYDPYHSLFWARRHGREFSRRLAQGKFDIIFAPVASSILPFLKTDLPIISLSDATFASIIGYYSDYTNMLDSSIRAGHALERLALQRSAIAVYPSQWAAESAIHDYGMPRERVRVYPLGANLEEPPERDRILALKQNEVCRLLFLGRDWERKGGSIALQTLVSLGRMGIAATLTVVGCKPPTGVEHPLMEVIPFVNKNEPEGRQRFGDILLSSDLLILPTRAECYGYVFAEASAFGLFSFATDTGGVPGVVRNGENGRLLPMDADGDSWARAIAEHFRNKEHFRQGRLQSRDAFEERLNWDAWGRTTSDIMRETLFSTPARQ